MKSLAFLKAGTGFEMPQDRNAEGGVRPLAVAQQEDRAGEGWRGQESWKGCTAGPGWTEGGGAEGALRTTAGPDTGRCAAQTEMSANPLAGREGQRA